MKRLYIRFIILLSIVLAGTVSTFAWFSGNSKVKTGSVNVTIGGQNIELLAGYDTEHMSAKEFEIRDTNIVEGFRLMPVSTIDASSFVIAENAGSVNIKFKEVTKDDKVFYYGSFYIMAKGDDNESINLYLDDSDGNFFTVADSVKGKENEILNAARFAIKIEDMLRIVEISQDSNKSERIDNTYLNGSLIKNQQLQMDNGEIQTGEAEIYPVSESMITNNNYPDFFFTLKTNKIYKTEIYLWLEGTDSDCSSSIELETLEININLLGVSG